MSNQSRILMLCGGVGGARMANGFAQAKDSVEHLLYAVNVGDDFEFLGLRISPDLDTVCYTLADLGDCDRGWGRRSETWSMMEALSVLEGPSWFSLGDKDLAWHLLRTQAMAQGTSLSETTASLLKRAGCSHRIVPVSDDSVRTTVLSDQGELAFQEWFVRERALPRVNGLRFDGACDARLSGPVVEFVSAGPCAVVIAPSNPYLSIDPMLAIKPLRDAITVAAGPIIAVSPIIGGASVKGPLARMMTDRGEAVSPVTIALHYHGLIDALFIDCSDAVHASEIEALGIRAVTAPLLITASEAQRSLAQSIESFIRGWL